MINNERFLKEQIKDEGGIHEFARWFYTVCFLLVNDFEILSVVQQKKACKPS